MKHLNTQRFIQALTTLVFVCLLQSAYAALPISLNYQGHLTDNIGTPIDGSINITFRIYNTQTDITPLWTDSQVVTVNQGVFSVELGSITTNPFPLGLFEQPLWIGLEVGSDGEMNPRRPITSTGFAFKADDANTLDGISASTLDQSAHVTDMANPHNVSTTQIGAADAGVLASHIGNTGNPHSVTAAQTGAASSGDFTAHASNSAAHHTRYTNGEAVAAMGTKNDTNALNHDKYSNASAVAAILAADGAGSTLDADKVDGLQASEIIDASQDEVRTPISSLPYTINASGSYYLTGNLDGSAGGIDITADDVTLDLMGFTIDGGGTVGDYGIYFNGYSNVTIRNGTIKRFGMAGIYQNSSNAYFATVMDVLVLGNGTLGTVTGAYAGIYLYSRNSHVERCTAGENGGYGIYANASSKLINNTAYNNTGNYGISGGSGAILSGNTAYYNTGNSGIYGGFGAILSGNTAYYNSHWGIYGQGANLVKDNTLYANNFSNTGGEGGLHVNYDSRVVGNTLDFNNQNNIYVSSIDNTIENNLVTDSTTGIFFNSSGNFYGNNRASGNTTNFNLNGTSQSTSTYLPNISF
jgi:parallel beta-helix repeat protein